MPPLMPPLMPQISPQRFPYLTHGRLFWKFLLFFFLAQMTAVLGVGLSIWATVPDHGRPPPASIADSGDAAFPAPPAFMPGAGPDRMPMPPPPPGAKPPIVHLLAGAVVSLIFAALLAAYVSRPIRRLREALQRGASGQLTAGLTASMGTRRDELADLGRDFDRMARHIAQLIEGQRRLLHDVSHEMRSPLARLSAIIGLIRQQPQSLDDHLRRLENESMRMDRLLGELLTLSRLESGAGGRVGDFSDLGESTAADALDETVDLTELLEEVIEDAAPESGKAGCSVELTSLGDAVVRGDAQLLYRLFDNLLRNALTHAAAGSWVGVKVTVSDDLVRVGVEDRGPGVFSGDLDRLFVPFYRASSAAGNRGHGLGLAIARQIADNHHGRIEAANRAEGGLRVSVTLPRATES